MPPMSMDDLRPTLSGCSFYWCGLALVNKQSVINGAIRQDDIPYKEFRDPLKSFQRSDRKSDLHQRFGDRTQAKILQDT